MDSLEVKWREKSIQWKVDKTKFNNKIKSEEQINIKNEIIMSSHTQPEK